jgi:hypothetical protein
MKTSETWFGLQGCLLVLLGVLGTSAFAHADDPPEAAGSDLKYFDGSWLCVAELGDGNSTTALTGTLHFSPWDAWVVGSFSPADANSATDSNAAFPNGPPSSWPPNAGHGPAIQPPHGGGVPNNLMFFAYDPVARAYVTFKFLGTGTYAMASSPGPDANGSWTWNGALSDNGNDTGALIQTVMSTSDPNVFNAQVTVSTDVGQTWGAMGQVRCVKHVEHPDS